MPAASIYSSSLLVKPDPPAAALHEIIRDLHLNDGADTGKAVDHDADQSAIAQTEQIGLVCIGAFLDRFADRDAVQQRAGLLGREHRRFAFLNRGVFLSAMGAQETQIEASFSEAIRIAREQNSISLQKRAEATCAEYHRQKASGSAGRGFRLPLW
jgi:hypothetical protein